VAGRIKGPRRVVTEYRSLTREEKREANLLESRAHFLMALECGHYVVRHNLSSRVNCGHCGAKRPPWRQ